MKTFNFEVLNDENVKFGTSGYCLEIYNENVFDAMCDLSKCVDIINMKVNLIEVF